MANSRPSFSDIGKKAKDLLMKDYNFDQKFTVSFLSATGMELVATGLKKDNFFFGDLNSVYRSGNTVVDVKADSHSNLVSTKVTVNDLLPSAKAAISFRLPDHNSGKLDLQYNHPHAAINSSIGLTPTPLLELSATIGSKDLCLGCDVGFDTASAYLTKYNAGIGLNKPDFSAALLLADKGKTLKGSYLHHVDPTTSIAAELTHRLSTYESSFTIGSSHILDTVTMVKTRLSDKGIVGILYQKEWRPKSLITFSAEHDISADYFRTKMGLALALKP